MGPCLVLAQLSHVAAPSSNKDSLIPTEFQTDKGDHQKCCLFFFPATPDWLASLEGQATGAYLETGGKYLERQAQAVGFGVRRDRGPTGDSFHISSGASRKLLAFPALACSTSFSGPVLATPGSLPALPQCPPRWPPKLLTSVPRTLKMGQDSGIIVVPLACCPY